MISLVTATLGRVNEVRILLDSLVRQTYKDFELVIVDQNSHRYLEEMVSFYAGKLTIKYIRSNVKGLSHNRNIGLKHCVGNIVGFPDDDCFYDENVLLKVADYFVASDAYSFLVSEVKDTSTLYCFIKKKSKPVTRSEILKYCISYNFFIRRDTSIIFDERLGVGATFGSGEETDYLWKLLKIGDTGVFLSDVFIYHPQNSASTNSQRAYLYGLGFGALFKKEVVSRKNRKYFLIFIYNLTRTVGGFILKKNKFFYYKTLLGRIKGFCSFPLES